MPSKATKGGASRDSIDVELMTDRTVLEKLSESVRANGGILVCHVCDDLSEVIAGIVIIRASKEAWVLCGPCLRKIPLQGPVAS